MESKQIICICFSYSIQVSSTHTTTFKFCRRAHLLDKLLMSKINLHISSNFFKLLCIGKRCFQPEVAKSSHIMCFMNWAPMLVQIFPWTGVSDYQKLHLVAPATADKFLIEKHMNKLIWRNLWMMLCGACLQTKHIDNLVELINKPKQTLAPENRVKCLCSALWP